MAKNLSFTLMFAMLLVLGACARPAPRSLEPTPVGEVPAEPVTEPTEAGEPMAEPAPGEGEGEMAEAATPAEGETEVTAAPTAAPAQPSGAYSFDAEEGVNIAGVLAELGDFDTLLTAAIATGQIDTLRASGPFTVFAPTDAAFAALPEGALTQENLSAIINNHVVRGEVGSSGLASIEGLGTAGGDAITISANGTVLLNGTAGVVGRDIQASNGVIHVIDAVLVPQAPEPTAAPAEEAPAEEAPAEPTPAE